MLLPALPAAAFAANRPALFEPEVTDDALLGAPLAADFFMLFEATAGRLAAYWTAAGGCIDDVSELMLTPFLELNRPTAPADLDGITEGPTPTTPADGIAAAAAAAAFDDMAAGVLLGRFFWDWGI